MVASQGLVFPSNEILPRDVILNIMAILAEDLPPVEIPFQYPTIPPQWAISHVCSVWRQIALATPRLWNNVRIIPHPPSALRLAEEWLARAKGLPILLCGDLSDDASSEYSALCRIIRSNICKKLHIISHDSSGYPHTELGGGIFDSLTDMEELVLEGLFTVDRGQFRGSFNKSFSRLQTLSLKLDPGFDEPDYELDLGIPWHQIRHLHITEQPLNLLKYLDILKECHLLEDCELNITTMPEDLFDEDDEGSEIQNITLPNMGLLSIRFECADSSRHDDIDTFLRSLVLPNLQSLSIIGVDRWMSAADDVSIYHRLGLSNLQELRIAGEPNERFNPGPILEGGCSLRLIEVPKATIFDETTLTALSTGRYGPCLETLISLAPRQTDQLIQMVKQRLSITAVEGQPQVTPFRKVVLRCQNQTVEQYQAALEELGAVSLQSSYNFSTITFQYAK